MPGRNGKVILRPGLLARCDDEGKAWAALFSCQDRAAHTCRSQWKSSLVFSRASLSCR